ncbi:hypothetical protein ACIPYR_34020 [Streptomyces parvus]
MPAGSAADGPVLLVLRDAVRDRLGCRSRRCHHCRTGRRRSPAG